MKHLGFFLFRNLLVSTMALSAWGAMGGEEEMRGRLAGAMTFFSGFDQGVAADFSLGDGQLYTLISAEGGKVAKAGLLTGDKTRLVRGEGLQGNALKFMDRESPWIFYRAEGHAGYCRSNWSGTVSVWLKVDAGPSLPLGFADPIQLTTRAWNDAAFFVDFNKEGVPRDFRLGVFADLKIWNPSGGEVDDSKRPLLKVENPPFVGDQWTHVVFTWRDFNSGEGKGEAELFLNGRSRGVIRGWTQQFTWREGEEQRLYLGLNYVGLMDEVSCFNRALSCEEVSFLHRMKSGVELLDRRK